MKCTRLMRLAPVVLALLVSGKAASEEARTIRPSGPPLRVQKEFGIDELTRQAVSGIACDATKPERRCVIVLDEGTKVYFSALGEGGFRSANASQQLLEEKFKEFDGEGAAYDGTYTYVVGSHSVKRKSCRENPASHHVIRFKARWTAAGAGEARDVQISKKLQAMLEADPDLKQHVGGCLADDKPLPAGSVQGLNIEGLAVRDGQLYFGFRGPSIDGKLPVYSVAVESAFGSAARPPLLKHLKLGAKVGIRDMVSATSAILLLVGPDDSGSPGPAMWSIFEWKDQSAETVRLLARLDLSSVSFTKCVKAIKPEALTILEETEAAYKVLVLSDGICDGGPLPFLVPRQ